MFNVLMAMLVVPLCLLMNGLRIALIGMVGEWNGREAAVQFHDYSGMIMLVLCFFVLCVVAAGCGRQASSALAQPTPWATGAELAKLLGLSTDGGRTAAAAPVLRPVKLVRTFAIASTYLSPDRKQIAIVENGDLLLLSLPSGDGAPLVSREAASRLYPEGGFLEREVHWSPDGKSILFFVSKKDPRIPGPPGGGMGGISKAYIARVDDGAITECRYGVFWAWSPDSRRIAWLVYRGNNPTEGIRRQQYIVVADVKTGEEVFSKPVPDMLFGIVGRTKPLLKSGPDQPEMWLGTHLQNASPSPDATHVVYMTDPIKAGYHMALGTYTASGIREIAAMPVVDRGYVTSETLWLPDSRRFLYITGRGGSAKRPGSQRLFVIDLKGQTTNVHLVQGEAGYGQFRLLQWLDAGQNLILYCHDSPNTRQQELWIGQLQGVR